MIFVSKIQKREQRWGRDKVQVQLVWAVHMVGLGVKTLTAFQSLLCLPASDAAPSFIVS